MNFREQFVHQLEANSIKFNFWGDSGGNEGVEVFSGDVYSRIEAEFIFDSRGNLSDIRLYSKLESVAHVKSNNR